MNRAGNAKGPDVEGIVRTKVALKCFNCGGIIKIGQFARIFVSWNFYYDHCKFTHLTCGRIEEMGRPTAAQ